MTKYLTILRKVYAEYKARLFPEEAYAPDILSSSLAPDTSSQTSSVTEGYATPSRRLFSTVPSRKLKRKGTDDLNSLLGDVRKLKKHHTTHEIDRYLEDNESTYLHYCFDYY